MKKSLFTYLRGALLSCTLFLMGASAYANHIIGMDMTYTWTSGSTYTVYLSVYGDCGDMTGAFPLLPTATPQVAVFNGGTYVTCLTLSVDSPSTGLFTAPVCPADTNLTTCTNLSYTIPGIKKFVYSASYTFTGTSHYWRFVFLGSMGTASFAGRQASITNIIGAGTSVICLIDTLDNTWHNNTSPTLHNTPTPFYCLNNPNNYDPNGTDPDGDSLSYFLVPGEVGNYPVASCTIIPGTFVGYTGTAWTGQPVTDTTPLQVTAGSFSFSHTTGDMAFTPNLTQRSLVVYNIDEYRNDTFIGNSQHEMVYLVQTCTTSPPTASITAATGAGLLTDSVNYTICHNTGAFSFHINPTTTGTGLQIYVSAASIPTGATFTITGDSTSAPTCLFSWTSTGVTPGTYTFYVTFQDNNCPITGTQTIAYTVVITGTPTIAAIGPVCVGLTATLTPTPAGGIWTSLSTGIATVGSSTGIVGGVSSGNPVISYSLGTGCNATTTLTVNPVPGVISGATIVCPGSTILLTDLPGGGTWSSSNTAAATVAGSGVATGVAAGTTTITYTVGGCSATKTVTVIALPPPISGTFTVCQFATTVLTDPGGGTWTSSNGSVATVGTTGIVTGVAPGTSLITYAIGTGCNSTAVVTVNPAPAPIAGTLHVCAGLTTSLSDPTTGGTWMSNPTVASVGSSSGIVTGANVSFTTTTIVTYTAPGSCTITAVVTVNALPGPIFGSPTACGGTTTALTDPGGGTWSSSNTLIATVGSSTGVVGGVSLAGGTATITYTLSTGCDTTTTITIAPVPDPIMGTLIMCIGGTTTLSDGSVGGYWQSNNDSIAIIDPFLGTVTGEAAGVDTITYTTSCTVFIAVTVEAAPPPIVGPGTVCTGSAVTLFDAATGGTWTGTTVGGVATVGLTTGVVTGGAVTPPATTGFVTITYTAPGGCTTTGSLTLYPPPGAIVGTLHVCSGQSTALTDPPGGGTWMSSNIAVASVTVGPPGGITTGGVPGMDTITYTQPGTGCTRSAVVTVNSAPGPILGIPAVCAGSCITLTDATTGGTWTSSTTSVATAGSSTGMICGIGGTTSTITYSLGGTCVSTAVVTVNALPLLFAVTGGGSFCAGGSGSPVGLGGSTVGIHYQLYLGGTPVGGFVNGTGGVITFGTEPAAGTYTVTATNPVTGCSRAMPGSATVTITPVPSPYIVTGGGSYCAGSTTGDTIGLNGSAAGVTYKLYNGATLVATVTGTSASLNFGTFLGAGTYTVIATSGGCTATMTGSAVITISALPTAYTVTTTGSATICPGGTGPHVGLSNSTIGVSYQLFVGGVATGSPLAGIGGPLDFGVESTAGTYTVVATNTTTGCTKVMTGSAVITISAVPAISGAAAVCAGATTVESAPGFTGGTWSSSNTLAATVVPTTGLVTGGLVSGSTTIITYTTTAGCTATLEVTVSSSPGPISGPNTVCSGATVTESDAPTGGAWTSSSTSIATVIGGVVTGGTPGPVTITYSLGSGCTVTKLMTVTASPATIGGSANLCAGATGTLTDAAGGGTWMSSNTATATVSGVSGICTVYGAGPGTSTITYTLGGCTATVTITVNTAPGIITGAPALCAGTSTMLGDATSGGTWTSSSTATATVDGGGDVYGLSGGTTMITYSLGGVCVATKEITVNPISPVTGSAGLCVGSSTSLTDGTPGGTWLSGNTAAATVSGGTVYGAAAGTSTVTYTTSAGCTAMLTVTVNTAPSAIMGTPHVCAGSCTPLSNTAGGGIWSSSNTTVATVNDTGLVCGFVPGTTTITYSLGSGCTRSAIVTVNGLPTGITGTLHTCEGTTTTLTGAPSGGTWSSSNTGVALFAIATSGTVTGGTPGTATITYTLGTGCSINDVFTSNAPPPGISGASSVCLESCTLLSDGTSGGAWTSSNTAVATVNAEGLVCGIAPGVTTIIYSLGTGCAVNKLITVLPPPPAIMGAAMVCVGLSAALSDATTGGTWSTGPSSLATINATTGVLWGVSSGTVIVSYTIGSGCNVISSIIVNALSPILGTAGVCQGLTTTLTDTTGAGTWSSSNTLIATAATEGVNTGIIGGVTPGTATVTYTLPTGCAATGTITVNPAPPEISGPLGVCIGSTGTLSDGISGGTWSSSNTGIATVSATGIVTGESTGIAMITYTVAGTGCPAVAAVTVNAAPPAIGGPSSVCLVPGTTITLTDALTGGTWSIAPTSIATINATTGVLSGVAAGTATAVYTIASGCTATAAIAVNTQPPPISGPSVVCPGSSVALTDPTTGGTWSSVPTSIAVVDGFGNVTGESGGTATILYTTAAGCAAVATVTVYPVPGAIEATTSLCQGTATTFSDATSGGTWSSSNTSVLIIGSATGAVTTPATGSSVITYTAPTGCSVTIGVVVNASPDTITGSGLICLGGSTALAESSTGGAWSSSNTAVATVDGSGNVYGIAPGTSVVGYLSGICAATLVVTVSPQPGAIEGPAAVCTGSSITLGDVPGGGTWSSDNTGVATVDEFTGSVTGISPVGGTADITYSLGAGCTTYTTIVVNPVPLAIGGTSMQVCAGATQVLFDGTTGGAWSSINMAVATIASGAGVLYGATAGTSTISYTVSTGCAATVVITVNPQPAEITGLTNICLGSTRTLGDAVTGGTWTSGNTTIASVVIPAAGVIEGAGLGAATIYYTLAGGCMSQVTVSVQPLPTQDTVEGGGGYCAGGAGVLVYLSNSTPGVNYLLYRGATATGTFAGIGAELSFGLQSVTGIYTVIAVSTSTGCSNAMIGSVTVTATPTTAPSVSISTGPGVLDTMVCSGASTTFTAIPVYGGTGATYVWKVDGTAVGTGGSYTFIPADGDVVMVTLSSDYPCVLPATASSFVRMTVLGQELPVANISVTPGDTVCRGSAVTLTALPVWGGPSPVYTWLKNGASAGGGAAYTYIPLGGDTLQLKMTSDYLCRLADSALSNKVEIAVDTPYVPVVTINASPGTSVAIGQLDTLTATVAGSSAGVSYQWVVNELPVAGATTNTFISNNFRYPNQDSVTCIATTAGICSATSFGWVYVTLYPEGVKAVQGGDELSIMPNPNRGTFTVKGTLGAGTDEEVTIEVTDMLGQVVYRQQAMAAGGKLNEQVSLGSIANGMYLLNIKTGAGSRVFHVVVEQ